MSASNSFDPINILDSTNASGVGSGGSLTVSGGISVGKDSYIGGSSYIGGNLHISGTSTSFADNILLINSSGISSDTGLVFKRHTNDITENDNYSSIIYSELSDSFNFGWLQSEPSTGTLTVSNFAPIKVGNLTASGGVSTIGSIIVNNNLVGINKTNPTYALDVVGTIKSSSAILASDGTIGNLVTNSFSSGSINVSGGATMGGHLIPSENITYDIGSATQRWKDLYLSGNTIYLGEKTLSLENNIFQLDRLSVTSTESAFGYTSGSVTINGGVGISGNLQVKTTLEVGGTIDSVNSTTGSVVLTGGLSISDTANSTDASNGGALTIAGGAGIGRDIRVGGGVFGASGTIGNFVATTSLTTGTLRATTVSAGNIVAVTSLTTGTLRATTVSAGNIIAVTSLTTGTLRATTVSTGSLTATSNTNTVGSIFTTGGNVGVGTVAPTAALHVVGTGIISGAVTMSNTTNATGVGTGGVLTVAGGASVANDIYIGGNVIGNNFRVSIQSTSFTVSSTDKNTYFILSGNSTVTLPSAVTVGTNFQIAVEKGDSVQNQISVVPSSGTISGRSNYVLSTENEVVIFISDGTNWRTFSTRNAQFANVYSIPGTYTFTVPNPVTQVYACVFGAGGGGGSGGASGSGNGGGGGGYVEGIVVVAPGDSLTVTVGEGGSPNAAGGNSSIGDLLASGGGAGGANASGSWGSNGSAGSGSGGTINRNGGTGGQAPDQTSGSGGGGGGAGRTAAGANGSGYLGGNGSSGSGGTGGSAVTTAGGSVRIFNFFREGGGGASGNLSGTTTPGNDGGFPGGGGSGSGGANTAGSGGDGCIVLFY
jgi:hypothetical protein